MWISSAVVALMVLDDRSAPFPEPGKQRRHQTSAVLGVAMQHLPFLFVGLAGLVQKSRRDLELANIVEQGGPPEPSLTGGVDLQLAGNQVREDPTRSEWPRVALS
jgi:hypothetical protein